MTNKIHMNGPMAVIRSGKISLLKQIKTLYQWNATRSSTASCIRGSKTASNDKASYLIVDEVEFRGIPGVIVCYNNPPVHQVGNPALDAYLESLKIIQANQSSLRFLIMYSSADPIHAGGDLKESLVKLDQTLEQQDKLKLQGASDAEIDILYNWGDERLHKAFTLYQTLDKLRKSMRILNVCSGGTRYGGSAEMVLMADIIVGDSRSALCFSEPLIGLIPGWGGIGRTISKAGVLNAKYLSFTATESKASDLRNIGVFNVVIDVPMPLPRMRSRSPAMSGINSVPIISGQKTDNPADDKNRYLEALEKNNEQTGRLLLPAALELATCPESAIPGLKPDERKNLITDSQLQEIIRRRSNPDNYCNLWNKPLAEVKDEISGLGRPLAPQSINALNTLFAGYDPATFNEEQFIKQEMELDARLYRDRRFRAGIIATLEQKVADFS